MNSKQKFMDEGMSEETKEAIKRAVNIGFTEKHPHEIPLHIGTEAVTTITSHYSLVIDTIKNKNHKLEKMMEEGKLDVTFIRVESAGIYKWYFEDHKTPRLTDRLTNELEEKTSIYRKPFSQIVGRGFRASQMSELSKLYFHLVDIPREFLKPELSKPWQEPKIRKESEQPKTSVHGVNSPRNEKLKPNIVFIDDTEGETNRIEKLPNILKIIRNLFARNKK